MTKTQKIWMWIFLALFAAPEILWSPVINFYYELSQTGISGGTHPWRNNFLQNSDNLNYLKFVIFFQLISLILFLICLIKNRKNIKTINYLFILIPSLVFFILVAFSLYLVLTFNPIIF